MKTTAAAKWNSMNVPRTFPTRAGPQLEGTTRSFVLDERMNRENIVGWFLDPLNVQNERIS